MTEQEKEIYDRLIEQVSKKIKQNHSEVDLPIRDWKKKEIEIFQNALLNNVNGQLSERWFYMHIKNRQQSLPRLDALNMLCKYIGETSWDNFVNKQQNKTSKKKSTLLNNWKLLVLIGIVFVIIYFVFGRNNTNQNVYNCTFYDGYDQQLIKNEKIIINILNKKNKSIHSLHLDSSTFSYESPSNQLHFEVACNYYKRDTITLFKNDNSATNRIDLIPDEKALMLRYFANSSTKDWLKKRDKLNTIIHNNAIIYQFSPDRLHGMDMYNKDEFIDKLTTPVKSLKNIEILDIKYSKNKVMEVKFIYNQ